MVGSIPRILKLVEGGVTYSIWVEVVGEQLRSLAKKEPSHATETIINQERGTVVQHHNEVERVNQWDNTQVGSSTSLSAPPGFGGSKDRGQCSYTGEHSFTAINFQNEKEERHHGDQHVPSFLSTNRFEQLQIEVFEPCEPSPINQSPAEVVISSEEPKSILRKSL
ncbi:hypothetical protein FRX31_027881 [Thalictrum thalictroides]|uniref:Uncharacterized protein n=1 Tax=Thalictrum thalictroides TaxID=46969 RepID=A0A7J6VD07_THATH|nr:hypothetical protein FRX31_027881 [Thalictrum thalictroides]